MQKSFFQTFLLGIALANVLLTGCGNPYNSSYSDALKYGSGVTGSANFIAARTVMVNHCFTCHAQWAGWNEAAFLSGGIIATRDLTNSLLYSKIRGNEVNSAGNMPPSESLSVEDLLAIRAWISNM